MRIIKRKNGSITMTATKKGDEKELTAFFKKCVENNNKKDMKNGK